MNFVFTLGMHDDHHFTLQYAECHPSLLAVILTIILEGEGRASEDQLSVGKI